MLAISHSASAQWDAGWDSSSWNSDYLYNQKHNETNEDENKADSLMRISSFDYQYEAAAAVTTGNRLPFYMTANSHGILSPEHSQGYVRAKTEYKTSKGKWALDVGADLIAYASSRSDYYGSNIHLQQLYAKANFSIFHITIGSKEREGEFVPSTLSSGNMVWSGNARTAPGIHFGMDDFASMIIVDHFLETKIDATWSKLTDGRNNKAIYGYYRKNYPLQDGEVSAFFDDISDVRQHSLVQGAMIHHKSAFIRTRSSWPFFITSGLQHGCMYAGKVNGQKNSQNVDWLRSAVGNKGETETGYNHLMSIDLRADLNLKAFQLGVYKQHYTDDMEGGLFDSGMDGLWGIELKLYNVEWLSHVVAEMLYTTNQNGVVYANDIYRHDHRFYSQAGNSNFYHDEDYGAWAHYGMGLGNPLLMSPIYNDDRYPDYQSNMIRAFHFGASGRIADLVDYIIKFHHQESWGTPFAPYIEQKCNTSVHFEADYKYGDRWHIHPVISYDEGTLFGNNFGFCINIRYVSL